MFKPLASQLLQHLTHQNNWSRKPLMPYAGKLVQFNLALVNTQLLILEDGSLGVASDNAIPDATIHIPPSLALRLMAKDEAAKMLIKIDGDSHLATELGKVLQHIRWDFEEDLSKGIGDIPANKITATAKKSMKAAKDQSINMAEMLVEFWQEEKPILAKKWQVEKFMTDVNNLRSDANRLEKKLQKLKKRIQESSSI